MTLLSRPLRAAAALTFILTLPACGALLGGLSGKDEVHTEYDEPPVLEKIVQPIYPVAARKAGVEGKVVLSIVIDREGRVVELEVVESEPPGVFDEAVIEALRKWRYRPAIKDGEPVAVRVGQAVEMTLNRKPPPGAP